MSVSKIQTQRNLADHRRELNNKVFFTNNNNKTSANRRTHTAWERKLTFNDKPITTWETIEPAGYTTGYVALDEPCTTDFKDSGSEYAFFNGTQSVGLDIISGFLDETQFDFHYSDLAESPYTMARKAFHAIRINGSADTDLATTIWDQFEPNVVLYPWPCIRGHQVRALLDNKYEASTMSRVYELQRLPIDIEPAGTHGYVKSVLWKLFLISPERLYSDLEYQLEYLDRNIQSSEKTAKLIEFICERLHRAERNVFFSHKPEINEYNGIRTYCQLYVIQRALVLNHGGAKHVLDVVLENHLLLSHPVYNTTAELERWAPDSAALKNLQAEKNILLRGFLTDNPTRKWIRRSYKRLQDICEVLEINMPECCLIFLRRNLPGEHAARLELYLGMGTSGRKLEWRLTPPNPQRLLTGMEKFIKFFRDRRTES